jgi:plastocyanin
MAMRVRFVLVAAVVAAAVAGGSLSASGSASAATPRVLMYDNDGPLPNQGVDFWTGHWSFEPKHVTVLQGEQVVFDNPAGNTRPHNVVSIGSPGQPFPPAMEAGAAFSSGLTRESILRPGSTWTLDTSAVAPGHYGYFCSVHPWMVGSITVLSP